LGEILADDLKRLMPQAVVLVEPGEWNVEQQLKDVLRKAGVDWELLEDRHFLCSRDRFREYAEGRKQLRMEFFYREMRRRYEILLEGEEPVGGKWNYDSENRGSFGRAGPGELPVPKAFAPDETTQAVLKLVKKHFPDHPGSLDHFSWPVTPAEAAQALEDFIAHRLPKFGQYQDAMWTDEAFLYHALLSAALNVKLLDPRKVIADVENAYLRGAVPLEAAEGFIRQVLGWREYIRGIYWLKMPDYLEENALGALQHLPGFYWTAETRMECLRQAVGQTLDYGYAHHIQRLMVTGLYALLFGVDPRALHEWYLAVYVDAVEWVELPNTLGMSQFADGGVLASKPYIATGNYIKRMSNYCGACPFDPAKRTGPDACPFTTMYWDFLQRHEKILRSNPRMTLQVRNLEKLSPQEKKAIRKQAEVHRNEVMDG
jgi:deoxyribodipyrimidine photolyase-related protein